MKLYSGKLLHAACSPLLESSTTESVVFVFRSRHTTWTHMQRWLSFMTSSVSWPGFGSPCDSCGFNQLCDYVYVICQNHTFKHRQRRQ